MQVVADQDFPVVRECQVLWVRKGEVIDGDLARYLITSGAPVTAAGGSTTSPGGASTEPEAAGGPPPLAGKGSSRDAWVAYAKAAGVLAVDEDATRDEIIAALRAAGVQVE